MPLYRVVLRELLHYRWNSLAGLGAVMLAVCAIAGTRTILTAYQERTRDVLEAKRAQVQSSLASLEADIHKAMGELGFNLVILPEGQDLSDWYADDEATATMDENYVDRLLQSGSIAVRYPVAQLRRRVQWPETKWTIIVVGRALPTVPSRGENSPPPNDVPAARHMEAISPGEVALGHELHHVLGMKQGDTIELFGRKMRVHKCLPREGNKDDIAIFMNLKDAQAMLGQPGRINEILALGCSMASEAFQDVRVAVSRVLPGTQVVERSPSVLAATKAARDVKRFEEACLLKEQIVQESLLRDCWRLTDLVNLLAAASCALWIGWLAWSNAAERTVELGLWRACGLGARRLVMLFLGRWMTLGMLGTAAGLAVVMLAGAWVGDVRIADPMLWGLTLSVAIVLSAIASVTAVLIVRRKDPAAALRGNA